MSEPDISTLARRLAEQNNVDWRALSGSGPEGKVVERDVLDFLARVMAGAEATDPTPEPLPEGMEAWPDQDLHEVRAGVGESASLGDLRQELADSVRPDDDPDAAGDTFSGETYGAAESVPFGSAHDAPHGSSDGAVAVDEDIFLFDEEGEAGGDTQQAGGSDGFATSGSGVGDGAAPAHGSTGVGEASDVDGGDDLGDLLVAGDEFDDEPGDSAGAAGHEDLSNTFGGVTAGDFPAANDDPFDGEPSADVDHGSGDDGGAFAAGSADHVEDSGVDDSPWSQPLTSSTSSDEASGTGGAHEDMAASRHDWGSDIALGRDKASAFGGDEADDGGLWGEPQTASTSDDDLWAGGGDSAAQSGEAVSDTVSAADEIDPWLSPASSSASPFDTGTGDAADGSGADSGADSASAVWQAADTSAQDLPAQDLTAQDLSAPDRHETFDDGEADFGHGSATEGGAEIGRGFTAEDEAEIGHGLPAEADMGHSFTADAGAQSQAEETGLDQAPAALSAHDLPLARSATILRRHIDLSALAASQLSVGNELGFDEPLGVAPFLLRAVAKAASQIDVPSNHVAMAVLDRGLELRRVGDAADRSFASLVAELGEPTVIEDEPRLVAADLSGLDLDEVVLDLDVPVVTLGRILYDNQRGAYRSTLALSGAIQPEAGARLLARVAELLDAPVRLVL